MKHLLICLLLISSFALFGSEKTTTTNDPLKNAVVNLYSQLLVYPQEKVYVQTDRPYYVSGEQLFFRAFLLHASKLTQATFSRYVYVELVSPVDTVVLRTQIRISDDKMFYGGMLLPESLPEGDYRLRAYTRYMENTGERFFYTRPVFIADPKAAKITTETQFEFNRAGKVGVKLRFKDAKTDGVRLPSELQLRAGNSLKGRTIRPDSDGRMSETFDLKDNDPLRVLLVEFKDGGNTFSKYIRLPYPNSSPSLSFYPEGGQLVNGMINQVAFKALWPGGQAATISGAVYNSHDELQCSFSTLHEGMGSFSFLPHAGESYYARYDYANTSIETRLPAAQATATSLHARWENDSLQVSVLRSASMPADTCYLLIHRQGVPTYFQPWDFSRKTSHWSKKDFSTGVSHLMLLNKDFKVLSERLIFNNRYDDPEVEITVDSASYQPRAKVSLDIRLPGASADTLPSSMAISVTDDKDVRPDTTSNIVSEILLSSELEGSINNPCWYFGRGNDIARAADLLMLTHGWRRYYVTEALQGDLQKPRQKPESSQSIRGVLKKPSGKVFADARVQLTAIGCSYSDVVRSDEKGRFEFTGFEFPDSTGYQLLSQTPDKTDEIEIFPDATLYPDVTIPFAHQLQAFVPEEKSSVFIDYVYKSNRKYLQENGMRHVDLPQVTVKATVKKKAERIDNGFIAEKPRWGITPDEIKDFPVASWEALFYRLPNIKEVTTDQVYLTTGIPKIVLNGDVKSYSDLVLFYNVNNVAQVDVYRGGPALRYSPTGTVILITTWPSSTWAHIVMPKDYYKNLVPLGYQLPVEFYSPMYDNPTDVNSKRADLRSTIYWKPNVLTNKDEKSQLQFYTADSPTTYSVTVEGVAPGRKLVYCRKKAIIKVHP